VRRGLERWRGSDQKLLLVLVSVKAAELFNNGDHMDYFSVSTSSLLKMLLVVSVMAPAIVRADPELIESGPEECTQVCRGHGEAFDAGPHKRLGGRFCICAANTGEQGWRPGYQLNKLVPGKCVTGWNGREVTSGDDENIRCLCDHATPLAPAYQRQTTPPPPPAPEQCGGINQRCCSGASCNDANSLCTSDANGNLTCSGAGNWWKVTCTCSDLDDQQDVDGYECLEPGRETIGELLKVCLTMGNAYGLNCDYRGNSGADPSLGACRPRALSIP
jgi:hypothetical protein